MKYEYLHLDVFANRPFEGNQLAVFLDATGLTAQQMQRIAAEMAFSETAFVFPPDSPDVDATLRIFTPARELPMAGHPTIGTAFALASAGRLTATTSAVTFGLGLGPIAVRLEWTNGGLQCAWMTQRVPSFGRSLGRSRELAAALALDEADLHSDLPPQEASSGVPLLFVPLASRDAVNRVRLDRAAIQSLLAREGMVELPVFVFSLESGLDDATVFSRMFAPLFGIPEDPATGGACGPLGGYLIRHRAVSREQALHMVSLQGVALGRPSRILISVVCDHGAIAAVHVGGRSFVVGGGFLDVPVAE